MSVLAQCPICKRKMAMSVKSCPCGQDMDKAKKNGNAIYYVNYRVNGKQRREKVGTSYKEAKAADGKRAAQVAENRILDINDSKSTFNDLAEWFLKQPRIQKLKSRKVLEYNLRSFLSEFGNQTIRSLTRLDLENYQIKRQDQGKSESYIDQEIGAARNMLNTAWSGEKVSGDALRPFLKTKKLLKKNANARDVVVAFDDFMRIMDVLAPHARNISMTAFYTGMRRGEIVNLTWDRVDLENRVITLEREHTKTDEKRIVPICDSLHKILVNIPRRICVDQETGKRGFSPYVFLYKGLPVKDIRAALRKACEKAGIPYGRETKGGITFHDLRHTFTTNMRRAGVHDTVIMAITGHKTRDMFDRYNSVDMSEPVEGLKAMERSIVDQDVDRKKEAPANSGKC